MTDHDSPDTPGAFDALDRRATSATAALDRAVDATAVPDFDAPATSRRRPISAIAVAAALVVIALVAAAVALTGGDDEQSTVAGQVDFTRLVLPDPGAFDYRIAAAFDGSDDLGTPTDGEGFASIATVYGPTDSDDPWSEAVVSYSLPPDETALGDESVDIGGPEATIDESAFGTTIAWSDGGRVRHLVSTSLDQSTLVSVARAAASSPDDGAIAGQQVLFAGRLSDVYPSLLTVIARGGDPFAGYRSAAVFYGDAADNGQRGLVVATSAGSDAALRAHSVLAVGSREVAVRGRPGVFAEFVGDDEIGMFHLAWLEDPQTLVRVDSIGVTQDELLDRLERLESVDAETFAAIVEEHSVEDAFDGDGTASESFEETGEPVGPTTSGPDRTELASVSLGRDDGNIRTTLFGGPDGQITLETMSETADSGSGSSQSLDSTESNTVLRDVVQFDGDAVAGVLLAGVVGPGAEAIAVVDTETGERISQTDPDAVGPSTATILGSDHVLFLAIVGAEYADRDLTIVATLADGSEVALEARAF